MLGLEFFDIYLDLLCIKWVVKRLRFFSELEREELKPDDITFLRLLSACNHGGLADEGQFYFETIQDGSQISAFFILVGKLMDVGCDQNVLSNLEEVVSELNFKGYEPDLNKKKLDIEDDEKDSQLILQLEDGSCL
ncbi:hypothetical protein TSUD_103640 [Trifolium subterraneum]|uniref:Uncharacterized protein n=1 Tax=Trifolium subterraneum TaxID=3900 RepID=A0A2Z6NLL2_TRISU|nr:hypothetical protein TSUD_103640 [Trifolium subterraneum]